MQPAAAAPARCGSCADGEARYTCPCCAARSCGLECVRAHKQRSGCTGKRKSTSAEMVTLARFDGARLVEDYRFLEGVLLGTDTAGRERSCWVQGPRDRGRGGRGRGKRGRGEVAGAAAAAEGAAAAAAGSVAAAAAASSGGGESGGGCGAAAKAEAPRTAPISVKAGLIVQHAKERGTAVVVLSPGMSKRESNTTFFDVKKQTLFWKVEWHFLVPRSLADASGSSEYVRLVDARVAETLTWKAALGKHLLPTKSNAVIAHRLREYCTAFEKIEHGGLVLRLRVEAGPGAGHCFYDLDAAHTLREGLRAKTIVEFPRVYCCLPGDVERHPTAPAQAQPDSSGAF